MTLSGSGEDVGAQWVRISAHRTQAGRLMMEDSNTYYPRPQYYLLWYLSCSCCYLYWQHQVILYYALYITDA